MAASDNISRVRAGYDAFNKGDVPVLVDLFDANIVWHFPGSSRIAGDHVGRDATLAALGAYGEAGGGSLVAQVIDVMGTDNHVAGIARDTAMRDGKSLDVRSTVVFAMRDGKITEAWHYIDDTAALDRFIG